MTETIGTSVANAAGAAPPDAATCLDCGYALRGLASRVCPECGRGFDPEVLTSMCVPRAPRTPNVVERRLLAPVPLPYRGARTALVVIAIIAAWMPPPSALPIAAVVVVWCAVALPYLARTSARRVVVGRYRLALEFLRVDDRGLWRMRRLFIVAALVTALHIPFFINFAISGSSLRRAARHWLMEVPMQVNPPAGARVHKTFIVTSTSATMSTVSFETAGGNILYRLNDRGDDVELVVMRWWDRL